MASTERRSRHHCCPSPRGAVRRHFADYVFKPVLVYHAQGMKWLVANDVDEKDDRRTVRVERLLVGLAGRERIR